jgi:hypothetical protein
LEFIKKINDISGDVIRNLSIDLEGSSMRQYFRLLQAGLLYISEAYKRKFKTNSYMKFLKNDVNCFGQLLYFLKISHFYCKTDKCLCHGKHFAIINPILVTKALSEDQIQNKKEINHIFEYDTTTEIIAISITNLITPCFHITNSTTCFVAEPINRYEKE